MDFRGFIHPNQSKAADCHTQIGHSLPPPFGRTNRTPKAAPLAAHPTPAPAEIPFARNLGHHGEKLRRKCAVLPPWRFPLRRGLRPHGWSLLPTELAVAPVRICGSRGFLRHAGSTSPCVFAR